MTLAMVLVRRARNGGCRVIDKERGHMVRALSDRARDVCLRQKRGQGDCLRRSGDERRNRISKHHS